MTVNRRQSGLVLSIILIASMLGGCQGGGLSHGAPDSWVTDPLASWSMWELAGRLDLSVDECSASSATLTSPTNTVILFPGPGARVFINGQAVDIGDSIAAVGDTLFVPIGIDQQIRPLLRQSEPEAPAQQPDEQPIPKLARVSGRVMIDPGHGGKDPGAIGITGLYEKNIALDTALLLTDMLKQRGVDVRMTRGDDTFIPLDDRAAMANSFDAELFVSVHADSSPSPWVKGFTVFVARQASKSSLAIAGGIKQHLAPVVGKDRGIQKAGFRVLMRTKMPAVLVEVGFLTNRAGSRKLADQAYRRRLAAAISDGIVDYLQTN